MAAPYTHLAGANDGRGILPLLLWRLTVTHILRRQEVNPKGIRSLSPGLRGTSYPGCDRGKDSPTLKGLQHLTETTRQNPAPCCNPFRVEHDSGSQPRVARTSQPLYVLWI